MDSSVSLDIQQNIRVDYNTPEYMGINNCNTFVICVRWFKDSRKSHFYYRKRPRSNYGTLCPSSISQHV